MFELPSAAVSGVHGVIDRELLSVIRRWAFRDKLSIRDHIAAHGIITEHDPEVFAVRLGQTKLQDP